MFVRFFLGIMWLIQCLPMAILAPLGRGLGALLYLLARERRHVTLTNLALCFPQMSEAEKVALAKQHFAAFGRSFLERGLMWWASEERLKRVIRIEGMEYLRAQKGKPTLLFSPHFMGLDMAGTRIMMEMDCTSIYSVQKNKVFNDFLLKGRSRFGNSKHFSRQEGLRPPVRAMRQGLPFFYLSDLDYGPNEAIFVPFFAFHAATITGLSRLARMGNVTVMTVYGRMDDDGWTTIIGPPWQDFPGESVEADTRRMNAELEGEMTRNPRLLPQYLWMHKRFKTRPEGEKRVYSATNRRIAHFARRYHKHMKIRFTKMHGLGNDFVVLDTIRQNFVPSETQAKFLADRHFGIGCDQILLVEKAHSTDNDFRYRIFNADGGEVEQCGNGARCFVRYVREQGLTTKTEIRVEISTGIIVLREEANGMVTVDMGLPRFAPADVPFLTDSDALVQPLIVDGQEIDITVLSMGNPHAVQIVANVDTAAVEKLGPLIENDGRFPRRVNAGFMQIVSRRQIRLRVHERGAGETIACGTGACAAVVTGIARGLLDSPVEVITRGGAMQIAWSAGQSVMMTGPAMTVFSSEIEIPD